MIFLSLRIHVKSILGGFYVEVQNLPFDHISMLRIVISMNFCTFWMLKSTKLTKVSVPKMAFFELLDSPKLLSRKIWVIEKSWNFHTVTNGQKSSKMTRNGQNSQIWPKSGKKLPVWSSSSETQKYSPNQHGDSTSRYKTWKIKIFHVNLA